MKFLVINGPNLNLLGTREPEIYGSETLMDLERQWHDCAARLGIEIVTAQSNSEGSIIDVIHDARGTVDGIIINAGALTHYSLALADALTAVDIPFVEVHISNVHAREEWRHHSVLTDGADAVIVGRGTRGYLDAIEHLTETLRHPPIIVPYGSERHHVMDVRIPDGDGPHPGVMLIHGGYWRSIWLRDLMDAAAVDLVGRGYITYNVEYTTGVGSYEVAIEDIDSAFDCIADNADNHALDLARLAVVGHSAGGFLALHLAERREGYAGVVGLGSVVDLDTVATDYPTDSPVDLFVGGSRADKPEAWEQISLQGSPKVSVYLVHGAEDEWVTPRHSEIYVQMTRGVAALTVLGGVGHMELIDPDDDVWRTIVDAIGQLIG